jgi:hypothetical protein
MRQDHKGEMTTLTEKNKDLAATNKDLVAENEDACSGEAY